jgi:hypothetical protein
VRLVLIAIDFSDCFHRPLDDLLRFCLLRVAVAAQKIPCLALVHPLCQGWCERVQLRSVGFEEDEALKRNFWCDPFVEGLCGVNTYPSNLSIYLDAKRLRSNAAYTDYGIVRKRSHPSHAVVYPEDSVGIWIACVGLFVGEDSHGSFLRRQIRY